MTVQGTGSAGSGGGNHGVQVENSNSGIFSLGADIEVEGTAGGSGSGGDYNLGVAIQRGGAIEAGGNGKITVKGNGGNTSGSGGDFNYGIWVSNNNSRLITNNGNLRMEGTGGGGGVSSGNVGLLILDNSQVRAGGSGKLDLVGQGGNQSGSGGQNYGVSIQTTQNVFTAGGDIYVDGTGGGSGTSENNHGIFILLGHLKVEGTGKLQGIGQGGNPGGSTGTNHGIYLFSATVTSLGDVELSGVEGGNGSSLGFININSSLTATSQLTLIGNSMSIGGNTISANSTTLRPYTNNTAINLGDATDTKGGPLNLSDAELDRFSTSSLVIGNAGSGNLTVSAAISRPTATNVTLRSGGDVIFNQNFNTNGGTLLLDPGTSPAAVKPTFNGTDATASTVSFASDLAIVINGITPGTGAGATYTQLIVSGNVNLTGVGLALSGSHTAAVGQSFTIVDNLGANPILGTFSGLAEGSIITNFLGNPLLRARITYSGGTGNDVVLTVLPPDYTITTAGGNLVVTDNSGNGETLAMSQSGSNIRFVVTPTTRTYSINGGPTTAFTTPASVALAGITSITLNTAAGNDIINIGAFTANLPSLTINGGTGNDAVNFNGDISFAANANLDVDLQNDDAAPGEDQVTIAPNANLILSGTGTATVRVSRDVTVNSGGSLETENGDLTVEANQQMTATSGNFVGVSVSGGALQVNGSGALSVEGRGGDAAGGFQYGIIVLNAGRIQGGSATVSLEGIGGASGWNTNLGVHVEGTNSRITSSGGSVQVKGTGGGSGTSTGNYGVLVKSAGAITAGGSGTVTVEGLGGTSGGGGALRDLNLGVLVSGSNSRITSSGGGVQVKGTGGGSIGTSGNNVGVWLELGAAITAGGSGAVTVEGLGGASSGTSNYGVYVAGGDITSSGGAVQVKGVGGGSGSSGSNFGVAVVSGAIRAGGSGTVTVEGIGGASSGSQNFGVLVSGSDSRITSSGGNVSVTGIEGGGPSGIGIVTGASTTITTATDGGNLTLIANSMNIASAVGTNAAGSTTLRPYTDGVGINLGTASNPIGGPLGLSDAELDQISTGALIIGDATSGNLTVSAAISRPSATNVQLRSGGDVTFHENFNTNDGTLLLSPGNSPAAVKPVFNGTDATASAVSFASDLAIVINGTTPGDGAGATYTQLTVAGDVNLTGVDLMLSGSHTPAVGQTFTLVDNLGANLITGTFTGLPEGAVITSAPFNTRWARISYVGGTGNDVVLTVLAPDYTITTAGGNLVVTDNSGNGDALAMSQSSGNVRFVVTPNTRTYSIDGGPATAFTTPADVALAGTNSITINTAGGDDNIDIGAFAAAFPSLKIDGGNDIDIVLFNGATTYATNKNLEVVNAETVTVNGAQSLSGTGSIDITANQITVNAQLTNASGNINLSTAGAQDVLVQAGVSGINSTAGILKIQAGRDLLFGSATNFGDVRGQTVELTAGRDVIVTGTTYVQSDGPGGIKTEAGRNLTVTSNSLINSNAGAASNRLTTGANGLLTIDAGCNIGANGGPITATADDIVLVGNMGTNGTVTIRPVSAGRSIDLGTNTPGMLSLTDAELDQITAGTLIIGRNDIATGTVTVSSAIAPANAAALQVITARDIAVNANVTGGSGGLTLSANQQAIPTSDNFVGVRVNGATITTTGDGTVSVAGTGGTGNDNYGVLIASGGQITSGGLGKVSVSGTGGPGSGIFNYGLFIDGANSRIASGGGAVEVNGQGGGGAGSGSQNNGIRLANAGRITSGGTGTVTVNGTGGTGTGSDIYGIVIAAAGQITSGGAGKVSVSGAGGSGPGTFNYGLIIDGADSQITSGGGAVEVNGQGGGGAGSGSQNNGIRLANAGRITSGGTGTVTVNGTGGTGTGSDIYGIVIAAAGQITSGGAGKVSVSGAGGSGPGTFNYGLIIDGANSQITSGGGAVEVSGQGGGGAGSGSQNHGIRLVNEGRITSGGSGTVTVTGTGGTGTGSDNYGLEIRGANTQITSSGGAVLVTGTGGGTATPFNYGVLVAAGGVITNAGTGAAATVTVVGQGGNTSGAAGGNYGIYLDGSNTQITSSGGAVSVTGIGNQNSEAMRIQSNAAITSGNNADITVVADGINLIAPGFITSGTGTTTIRPRTTGTRINLGGADVLTGSPLTLGLTDSELDQVTTGTLILGDANSGNLTVSAAISRPSATNVQLRSGGDVTFHENFNTNGGTLLLAPGNSPAAVKPVFNGTDATASAVSFASDLAIVINGTTPGDGAGATYTQLTVAGDVNLTGVDLMLSGSHTPAVGQTFTLVDNLGANPITGTFTGLPEGAVITSAPFNTRWARISYVGGTGNDVVLTVLAPDYTITTAGGNLVVTDNSGNGDVLSMDPSGANAVFNTSPTRSYALDGGATMSFPLTINNIAAFSSITINQASGDDQFDIGAFSGLQNLTINGGTGNDAINFNGDITFAANANLDVDLQNDDATPGEDRVTIADNANLILSGTGTATVKVSRNVTVNSGGSLETENGDLTVEANQQMTATSGNFVGVNVQNGAVVRASGSGAVTVLGRGGSVSSGGGNYGVYVNGSQITSGGGPVLVEGTGGGSNPGGGGNIGVYVDFGGAITSTGTGSSATVTVKGFGGNIGGGGNYGVFVNGSGSRISSSGGAVLVEGTGSGTEGGGHHGVYVNFGGAITSTGTGSGATVTVKGFGGNMSSGGSYGVYVNGISSQITSNGGAVLVEGTGGGADGGAHYGVYVDFGGAIVNTGMESGATVTVRGFGGNTSSGGGNHGVYVSSNGSQITSNGGAVRVAGTGGGTGATAFNYGVYVGSNGAITSTGTGSDAAVTVEGTGGNTTGSSNYGVFVSGTNAQITSSGGAVLVKGTGGGIGDGGDNSGVYVTSGGVITSTGTGSDATVTVEGTGGNTTGNSNHGVYVFGANSLITSSGGPVSVIGQGGGSGNSRNNYGVFVQFGSQITAGGSGTVTVEGLGGSAGGNGNAGVHVVGTNARITSSGGDVQVKGTSGGSGSSNSNRGVILDLQGEITAGGSGAVTVEGVGSASGGDQNLGVFVSTNARITSSGGDVSVTGQGGGSGVSLFNHGILVDFGGEITAGMSGEVTLQGTGGTSSGNANHGVALVGSARISSSGGDVLVTGYGGGSGASSVNNGVYMEAGGVITAGSSGKVTVQGTGGASTGIGNYGIQILDVQTHITSSGGDVDVTGIEGGGPSGIGLFCNYGFLNGQITTVPSGGDITITANSMYIASPLATPLTNSLTLRPYTLGVQIDLGSGSDPIGGPLSLTDAEFYRITTGALIIGDAAAGNLTVSAAISCPAAMNVTLRSGDDVIFNENFNTNGGTLLLAPGNSPAAVKPVFNGTDATASAVSFASDLAIVINGTTPGDGSGATHTQLTVAGDVNLTGVDLVLSGTHAPEVGQTFTIVDNLGANPVTGTFTGLPEGALLPNFLGSNLLAAITYLGGTGNDVVLEVVCPASTRLYVNDDATGANNGSSWADAFTSLQTALALAGQCANITEIWVAEGTYKPTTSTDRSIAFLIKSDIEILGGFPNSGNPGLADRNWSTHLTTLSGEIGAPGLHDNSYQVVFFDHVSNSALLDGFTITGGNGETTKNGGGIYNDGSGVGRQSNPRIANCTITGNVARSGAGLFNDGFRGNSSPEVVNCIFSGNKATRDGGGAYNFGGDNGNSNPSFVNCVFSGNKAERIGGGVFNDAVDAVGGVCSPDFVNCSFSGNQADFGVGGMYNDAFTGTCSPIIVNCILWGNAGQIDNRNATPTVQYSLVEGGYAGTGNLDLDPLFVNQPPVGLGAGGNLRLQACSPAIDAGNDAANATTADLDNNPRKFEAIAGGQQIDLGAFEYQQPAPVPTALCKNINVVLDPGSVSVAASDIDNGSDDDTCGPVTLSINGQFSQTYSCSDLGPNTATLSVYATQSNRTATCTAIVTVVDQTPPTITCPNPVTVTCASQIPAVNLNAVSASDNCGTPTKTFLGAVTSDSTCANRKTVTRTYRATDSSGNSATCSQVITVFDNTQPVFTFVPANVTVQCNSIPAVGTPVATDGCGGSVTITYNGQMVSNVLCTDKYTLTRQWTATDACGNTRTASQKITVTDSQKPAFVGAPANITVQCDAIPAPTAPTATDNCATVVAITYAGETRTNGTCLNRYTLTRRWVAADNCGNTVSVSQRISVVDTGKPTLTIPTDMAIACSDPIPPVGTATASDGCAGAVTISYLGQSTTSGACPGSYQIKRIWRATDACGNTTAATQTIQISDNSAPVFVTVPGPLTIECNTPLPPLVNPTASDACGGYVHITFLGNVHG
jgi:mucin-19